MNMQKPGITDQTAMAETSINPDVMESIGTTEEAVEEDSAMMHQEEEDDIQAPIEKEDEWRNLREPTDAELWKALDTKYPVPEGHKEAGKVVLALSIDEFWDLFHAENAPYTFDKFFQYRGFRQITVSQ